MSLREEGTTENDISEVPAVSPSTTSAIYDRKRQSKVVRVLTVLAYVLSVSLAAILLSIYYIFMWDGQPSMAAKSQPQAYVSLDAESRVHLRTYGHIWNKEDFSLLNANESFGDDAGKNENSSTGRFSFEKGYGDGEKLKSGKDGVEEEHGGISKKEERRRKKEKITKEEKKEHKLERKEGQASETKEAKLGKAEMKSKLEVQANLRREEEEEENERRYESRDVSVWNYSNSTVENTTDWTPANGSLSLGDYRLRLPQPEPTMDYEDSTLISTPMAEENSTWLPELDDLNSDYGILNKRSVFMKKLFGHHNVVLK